MGSKVMNYHLFFIFTQYRCRYFTSAAILKVNIEKYKIYMMKKCY